MPASYDTIIVGMGAAGCTAGSTLAHAGKRVLALEAQDRIGGRVRTVPFGNGVVELGAEWIHGEHPSRVYDLAIKNNVTILPQDLAFQVFRSDGSSSGHDIVNELVNFALEVVEDPPEKPEPLGQYITRRVMAYIKEKHPHLENDKDFIEELLHFMDLIINNYESSNSWNDVTTHSLYEELEGNQHMSWHKNGYKTLFEILLNTYNKGPGLPNLEIKLNTEVTQISWPQDPNEKVVVKCKDGATYIADNVIVTVSLGVLKERYATLFSPQLPQSKISAIDNIAIGLLDKVVLSFSEAWWADTGLSTFLWRKEDKKVVTDGWTTDIVGVTCPKGSNNTMTVWIFGDVAKLVKTSAIDVVSIGVIHKTILSFTDPWWPTKMTFFPFIWKGDDRNSVSGTDYWVTRIDGATIPMGSNNTLTFWSAGEDAKLVETLPDDVVRRKVMGILRRFMGANRTIPEPTSILRSNWYSNQFTRGSYSYDNLMAPQYPNARVDLSQPLLDGAGKPRVLFAGEATDRTHFSTVHGATDTGYREAMRLLPTASKI